MTRREAPGPSTLQVGEIVHSEKRSMHVSARDIESVIAMRAMLIDEARAGATVTYGEVVRDCQLPVPPKGLGRLLVLLSEDCARRGEPTLAAIVVTAGSGEVGHGYGAGASTDRQDLYAYWGA